MTILLKVVADTRRTYPGRLRRCAYCQHQHREDCVGIQASRGTVRSADGDVSASYEQEARWYCSGACAAMAENSFDHFPSWVHLRHEVRRRLFPLPHDGLSQKAVSRSAEESAGASGKAKKFTSEPQPALETSAAQDSYARKAAMAQQAATATTSEGGEASKTSSNSTTLLKKHSQQRQKRRQKKSEQQQQRRS